MKEIQYGHGVRIQTGPPPQRSCPEPLQTVQVEVPKDSLLTRCTATFPAEELETLRANPSSANPSSLHLSLQFDLRCGISLTATPICGVPFEALTNLRLGRPVNVEQLTPRPLSLHTIDGQATPDTSLQIQMGVLTFGGDNLPLTQTIRPDCQSNMVYQPQRGEVYRIYSSRPDATHETHLYNGAILPRLNVDVTRDGDDLVIDGQYRVRPYIDAERLKQA